MARTGHFLMTVGFQQRDPAHLLQEHRPTIRALVAEWCRQQELWQSREQELFREVLRALQADDFARLRAWTGRVSLTPFLATQVSLILEDCERRRGKALLEAHHSRVERLCGSLVRKKGLNDDEADELLSETDLRLCDGHCRYLRRFRGDERQLGAYLRRIVGSTFVDTIVRRKRGRFRPSETAKQLGLEAEELEKLIYGRGFTVREAILKLRQEIWAWKSEDELAEIAARLPVRERPQEYSIDSLGGRDLASGSGRTDDRILGRELKELCERFIREFQRVREKLDPADQVLLRLLFEGGLSVAEAARRLDRNQRRLYRQRDKALRQVRKHLEEAGLDWETVRPLVEESVDLSPWDEDDYQGDEENEDDE